MYLHINMQRYKMIKVYENIIFMQPIKNNKTSKMQQISTAVSSAVINEDLQEKKSSNSAT